MKWNPPPAMEPPRIGDSPSKGVQFPQATALLIVPAARRPTFLHALTEFGVDAYCANDCREARELLRSSRTFRLVVTDVSLPDGNWCDVMRMVTDLDVPASVVVDAPEINQTLWSEVFWRGAYDLLAQHCNWNDLRDCLEGALRAMPLSNRIPNLALSA